MNRYLLSLVLLVSVCFEYKEPKAAGALNGLLQSLQKQHELFYTVTYQDSRFSIESEATIFGLVHLKKNKLSGFSNAYFGSKSNFLPNHLESYYLKEQFAGSLSSKMFTDHHVEALIDSLHSPLLLNTENLIRYESKAAQVKEEYLDFVTKKTSFMLNEKQLDLVWDTDIKKIVKITYHENIGDESKYFVRSWKFQYMEMNDFMTLSSVFKAQNEQVLQEFL